MENDKRCGCCGLILREGEKRGQIVTTGSESCNHLHHYRCLIAPLALEESSTCPICSIEYSMVTPVLQQQKIMCVHGESVEHPEENYGNPCSSSSSLARYMELNPTPPATPESIPPPPQRNEQVEILPPPPPPQFQEEEEILPPPQPPQFQEEEEEIVPVGLQQQPPPTATPRNRRRRIARSIFRRETENPNPNRRGLVTNTHPLSRTCQYCLQVYNSRMKKSRCEESHLGPYRCHLCNREFELHSYLRKHFLRKHG